MNHPYYDVMDFHEAFGLPIEEEPQIPDQQQVDLRADLLWEEYMELIEAMENNDLVEIADALADMQYIINGTALVYGIDLDAVHTEVHNSNMAKLGPNDEVIRRADGKVLKPEGWQPPDIRKVLGL